MVRYGVKYIDVTERIYTLYINRKFILHIYSCTLKSATNPKVRFCSESEECHSAGMPHWGGDRCLGQSRRANCLAELGQPEQTSDRGAEPDKSDLSVLRHERFE